MEVIVVFSSLAGCSGSCWGFEKHYHGLNELLGFQGCVLDSIDSLTDSTDCLLDNTTENLIDYLCGLLKQSE